MCLTVVYCVDKSIHMMLIEVEMKNKTIQIRMDDHVVNRIDAVAEKEYLDRSSFVRKAVQEYIDMLEEKHGVRKEKK